MKNIALMLGAGALAFAGLARAEDNKVEEKHEVKKDEKTGAVKSQHHMKKKKTGKSTDKTEVKSDARHRMGGGTVSTTTTEVEHDQPGMKDDHDTKVKERVEKDAAGNVVEHEKKTDSK